jgi:hypothetical protein
MFKLDNLGIILFVSFSYKKLLQCSFYENLTNRFFRKKFKKVCVIQRRACNKFKISNTIISKTTTIQNILQRDSIGKFLLIFGIQYVNLYLFWGGHTISKFLLTNKIKAAFRAPQAMDSMAIGSIFRALALGAPIMSKIYKYIYFNFSNIFAKKSDDLEHMFFLGKTIRPNRQSNRDLLNCYGKSKIVFIFWDIFTKNTSRFGAF